ncbi:MAG TPA: hypothetical protein PL155_05020 [Candidatus Omnitrophota bacterium]|nr:hypothetical protein [Candidatus Omnitrophota bacterium]HPD84159.1 hypothetical protein [Candidatus Omnitrophota bacterium]HRZ03016.1 hypothetical protein [Candidatus Omnitrophota bacterium]
MDILFLVFNALIFIRYFYILPGWGIGRVSEKLFLAYLLTTIQIIGTLLLLGAIGWLRPFEAVALNAIIILFLHYFSYPVQAVRCKGRAWREIVAPLSSKIIIIAVTAVLGWLLACAYFLPPRDIDDLTYHLPFIYESIQRGIWVLLPTDLRIHFAYPMNAEVFFSWPVLFLGDTRWVDAAQIPVGAWTAGIIYLFARHFGLRRARAFFLSGIFFLTPLVIAHMRTNYVDLLSAGFLLSSLYLMTRFFVTTRKIYARLAFLSIGAMMGIKYHLLFWGLILGLGLLFVLARKNWKSDFLWGLFAMAGLGLGWHLRNYWLFSDWIYPARVTASAWGLGQQSLPEMLISIPDKLVEGGWFGLFCGPAAFLSWIFLGWRFLYRKHRMKKGEVLLFGVALSFFLIVIPIGKDEYQWIGPRILLVAWPIILLFFGRVIFLLNRKPWIRKLIIAFCFLGIAWDAMSSPLMPQPFKPMKSGQSEFEYYHYASGYVGFVGSYPGILDIMTQSLPRGSTIFLAVSGGHSFSAPFYGRFLQARIVNFDPRFEGDPDFLVYYTISPEPLTYIGKYRKTLTEAVSSEYREVFSGPGGRIFAHPRVLGAWRRFILGDRQILKHE